MQLDVGIEAELVGELCGEVRADLAFGFEDFLFGTGGGHPEPLALAEGRPGLLPEVVKESSHRLIVSCAGGMFYPRRRGL